MAVKRLRWGLGFADLGPSQLHRGHWTSPDSLSGDETTFEATYNVGPLSLTVSRVVNGTTRSFTETYRFKNTGAETINLSRASETAFTIYTPFNDHYTNATDTLSRRTHAHLWVNGGSSAWVKLDQMGGHGRNLGLVLTKGSLAGYSISGRDTITSSNTRGAFALHPSLPALDPLQEADIEWTFFWHDDWDNFFEKCAEFSDQFIRFDVSSYTVAVGETARINMTGTRVNSGTMVNGEVVQCDDGTCYYQLEASSAGSQPLRVSTSADGETQEAVVFLNRVPKIEDLISARAGFIVKNQQISDSKSALDGAYAVYDNQMEAIVTFDTARDRNVGRERVGMGVFIGRWLKDHPDPELESSLSRYYTFVCTQLQDDSGYVLDGPGSHEKRLYNWPWVMQLHLVVAALDLDLSDALSDRSPIERFVLTLENYYDQGGSEFYPIGLPVLEGLRALEDLGHASLLQRALSLFTKHGEFIVSTGTDYPVSEVNFEQSIVAPAATILLELYRWTGQDEWLEAAKIQVNTLLRFGGKQPDFRLHDVAIRHWDGYWFGKDGMWGDTFPHYWSTITAVALHHYGKATNKSELLDQADGILRSNLALFTPEGEASCAWLYPLSVDGRTGHYPDPYANDQDWALAHYLQLRSDNKCNT